MTHEREGETMKSHIQPAAEELKAAEHFFSTQNLGLSLVRIEDGRVFDIESGYDDAVEIHEGNLLDIGRNIVDWMDDPNVQSTDDFTGEAKVDWDWVRTNV